MVEERHVQKIVAKVWIQSSLGLEEQQREAEFHKEQLLRREKKAQLREEQHRIEYLHKIVDVWRCAEDVRLLTKRIERRPR